MNLLYGADEYVARWVQERIEYSNFEKYAAIGVMDGTKLLAGVVYHNYYDSYKNIEMSIAADSPRWASRRTIGALLAYPFIQLECQRVTALIAANNEKSLRLNKGLGFQVEGVVRRGFGDKDMVVTGLLREEAEKWLKHRG